MTRWYVAMLESLAAAGADLYIVMEYRYPEAKTKLRWKCTYLRPRSRLLPYRAGLGASSIPSLLVEGDNKPGLAYAVAKAIADAGINLGFLVAQVVGRRYSAVVGFDSEADANNAAALIKKATTARKK